MIKLFLCLYWLHYTVSFASNPELIILENCNDFDIQKSILITPPGMGFLHKDSKEDLFFTYQISRSPSLAVKAGDFVFLFSISKYSSIEAIFKIINAIAKPSKTTPLYGIFYFIQCCDYIEIIKKYFPDIQVKIDDKDQKLSLGINKNGNFFLFPAENLLRNMFKLKKELITLEDKRIKEAFCENYDYTQDLYNKNIERLKNNRMPCMSFKNAPSWWIEKHYPVYDAKYCALCHIAFSKENICIFCSDECQAIFDLYHTMYDVLYKD